MHIGMVLSLEFDIQFHLSLRLWPFPWGDFNISFMGRIGKVKPRHCLLCFLPQVRLFQVSYCKMYNKFLFLFFSNN